MVGQFVTEKVIPTVGRIAKPALGIISALPGKLGMIGKVGSTVLGALGGAAEHIPNQQIREGVQNGLRKIGETGDRVSQVISDGAQRITGAADAMKPVTQVIQPTIDKLKPFFQTVGNTSQVNKNNM